ncbi:MAG: hypothetical protein IPJ27_06555 [Candidatus Accumulibacter sp.]|uniref:Uncharacterized protein n=1 Tax=Candidatus Accumulibacter proximus TaxID=2954385 RepID=A0A935PYW1_9PROT|nr:hypothetical protein [Candidatus Accumulibacter proximus]
MGNAGMTQWSGWAAALLWFLRQHGAFVIIGCLGDALSDKHLDKQQMKPPDSVEFWSRWVVGDLFDMGDENSDL